VVATGITLMLVMPVTVPTPLLMLSVVVLLVVHERTAAAPDVKIDGVAMKLDMAGGRTTVTVNCAVDVTPEALVAVSV
jgi:hypothetical protein